MSSCSSAVLSQHIGTLTMPGLALDWERMDGSRLQGLLPSGATFLFWACSGLVIWVFVRTVVTPWREWIFYRKQGIKGPPFRPFLGNFLELRKIRGAPRPPSSIDHTRFVEASNPHLIYWANAHAPGQQRLLFQTLNTTNVFLWDASLAREFLTKHSFYKRSALSKLVTEKLTGKGLVVLDTDEWAPHRKILNPGFRLHFLKGFHEYMTEAGKELVQDWLQEVHQRDGSTELLISAGVKKASLDIIARAVFGANVAGSIPVSIARKVFETLQERVDVTVRNIFTFSSLVPALRVFLETEEEKKSARDNRFIDDLLKEIVDARIKAVQSAYTKGSPALVSEENHGGHDLLGLMVDAMLRGSKTMARAQVLEECRTLFVAGQATTATLVSFTLLMLAHHPDWQQKVRDEVMQVTGNTGVLEAHSMDKLRITGMVLNEVLRLFPPASTVPREALVRHTIGDLEILPGTDVTFHLALIHGCEKYWKDPSAFKPERFERGIAAATLNKADAFFPFGGGPRVCIGQNFALLAAKSLVASVVHRFSLRVSPNYQHTINDGAISGSSFVRLVVQELKG